MQSQLSPHELAYQESLIHEREAEIREIESGMHELAEIFRDLGTLVGEQGQMIGASLPPEKSAIMALIPLMFRPDDIGNNIFSVANNVSDAADELTTAHQYQRRAGRRMACLMMILSIVLGVVLLAVRPISLSPSDLLDNATFCRFCHNMHTPLFCRAFFHLWD